MERDRGYGVRELQRYCNFSLLVSLDISSDLAMKSFLLGLLGIFHLFFS